MVPKEYVGVTIFLCHGTANGYEISRTCTTIQVSKNIHICTGKTHHLCSYVLIYTQRRAYKAGKPYAYAHVFLAA